MTTCTEVETETPSQEYTRLLNAITYDHSIGTKMILRAAFVILWYAHRGLARQVVDVAIKLPKRDGGDATVFGRTKDGLLRGMHMQTERGVMMEAERMAVEHPEITHFSIIPTHGQFWLEVTERKVIPEIVERHEITLSKMS